MTKLLILSDSHNSRLAIENILAAEAEKASGQAVRILFQVGEAPKASPQENLKSLLDGSGFTLTSGQ